MAHHSAKLVAATLASILILAANAPAGTKLNISAEDIKLISAEPLKSKARSMIGKERVIRPGEPDTVSEKIAKSLISQLGNWGSNGKQLISGLFECSAIHTSNMLGDKSPCLDDYMGEADVSCLVKRGVGKHSVGQILTADRQDLNSDGIPDYIISDRYYCQELSANQSNVYFVMLSDSHKNFHLSYAGWASFALEVVEDPTRRSKVLIERAYKTYGVYSRVMQLVNDRFVPRICIVRDNNGYDLCDYK